METPQGKKSGRGDIYHLTSGLLAAKGTLHIYAGFGTASRSLVQHFVKGDRTFAPHVCDLRIPDPLSIQLVKSATTDGCFVQTNIKSERRATERNDVGDESRLCKYQKTTSLPHSRAHLASSICQ